MLEIRHSAEETRLENAQVSRIRETLIKIGAKVTVSGRRILVELANYCPFKEEIKIIIPVCSALRTPKKICPLNA